MIIVTGATGTLNGATVDHLLQRTPASDITVAVRDPAKAQRFADLGVAVRQADYADPSSLPGAFEGADQLLLVSANDPGADAASLHRAAIDAAISAQVGRILYTSHQGASPDSTFGPARSHAATELMLEACGIPWTALRNGFYAHSAPMLMGPWRETGVVSVPADGPVSWTFRDDAAEAAALILASGGAYEGPVTLTAGAAPTFEEATAIAAEQTGQPVTFELTPEADWITARMASGVPEPAARFMLGMYQAAAGGFFAETQPLLRTILGREPRTVSEALAQSLAAQ